MHKFCKIFDEILKKAFPKLKKLFDQIEFDYLLWFSKWLQTLFTYNFEFSVIRVFWDLIIFKNIDHILLISLAIIDYNQKKLIKYKSLDDMVENLPQIYQVGKENDKDFNNFKQFIHSKLESPKYLKLIKM